MLSYINLSIKHSQPFFAIIEMCTQDPPKTLPLFNIPAKIAKTSKNGFLVWDGCKTSAENSFFV